MRLRISRAVWSLALAASLAAYTAELTPGRKSALDHISAQSLKGHLSFLASDALEGRDTPSRGLDVAAEYIASQFRRIGLKPAGDDGYFQTARFVVTEHSAAGAELDFEGGQTRLRLDKNDLRLGAGGSASLSGVAPVKFAPGQPMVDTGEGKVIVVMSDRPGILNRTLTALEKWKPSAVLVAHSGSSSRPPEITRRLEDAEQRRATPFPVVHVYQGDFFKLAEAAKPGAMDARISLHVPAPEEKFVDLRNVAGILPGSDAALAGEYVLVTAHYDHLGRKPDGDGDRIFNGANDDASGVASVIEIAQALAAASAPRRSVLFIAYFGEEEGLFGSRYYGRHPLVPLNKTVADLNLEQLGRTDGDVPAGAATMTGFGFSDISTALKMAGAVTGVKIHDPGHNGDDFFARSDNQSLADRGIPAHTFATAFDFPDYHQVGDEWQKIDYANMEKVDRMLTLTILMVADSPEPPHWNESNAKAERYIKAQRDLK
jgi:hypothetical protein